MAHISVVNLSVTYGGMNALNNINVEIPDGAITAIIGPSGCGKTTLLKSLNRLLELNDDVTVHGEVRIDGKNVYAPGTDVLALRKEVGFLAQRPYPLPMSIYENIAFGPRTHGLSSQELLNQVKEMAATGLADDAVARQIKANSGALKGKELDILVEAYLRLAGLWDEVKDRLRSPAAQLSVGQQQRLALARTLAVNPSVILADEPTSALDPVSAKLIETQFQMLKRKYTIVVVTHILRQARRIADHAMFMYLGELIEHGTSKEMFNAPKDPRTKAYISGEIS